MAQLTDGQRRAAWRELMQELSRDGEPVAITKQNLLAAAVALDEWFDDNAATLNQAIPQPARGGLTAQQKARLLVAVVRARYLAGGE